MNKNAILIISIILLSLIPLVPGYAEESDPIGYKIYGDVVEVWNHDTTYYFNKSSGIQWTEDPEQYWARNIFAIGYYSSGEWHKIYSADELGTFNREITTDDLTYVNITFWKDFNYAGYDLRLGVRYHLKVDDEDLSIIIYAKNLDTEDYPVELGFAWMVTDIDIPNPLGEDTIFLNGTDYRLDGVFDLSFKNMSHTYFDHELNETVTEFDPHYRIFDYTEFLTLEWDKDVDYKVRLQCNGVQEEARVTWMVNGGIFQAGQEKSTTLYWADAEGDYTGIHWDTGAADLPRGIATDGINIWIVDDEDDKCYKYTMTGTPITSWDLYRDYPRGITVDGTNIFIADSYQDEIHKYDMSGNYISKQNIAEPSPEGIGQTGNNLYVTDASEDSYRKYVKSGSTLTQYFLTGANANPSGLTTDGTYIWVTDDTDDEVYKYNLVGGYLGSWDISGQCSRPEGITTDGSSLWIVDATNDEVYKYEYIPKPVPTIESIQIPNMDNIDDLFPMYRWYEFEVVLDYVEGADEIAKVYLRANDTSTTIFEVHGDSLDSIPSWSIQTGSNIIDLDTGSCSWETSGTEGNATFKIRIEYDHPQYLNMELDGYVEDIDAGSSGWLNKQTDYFDVITNLVTTFNLDDNRGNLSQSVTASGQINFEDSSLYPVDSNFTGVSVYDSSNNNEGTDSTVTNGAWSITFNTPSSVGTDTYNLYIDIIADYPDGEETSPTDTFVNDRYNVTSFWASSYDLQTGENITLYAIFESEYDSHISDGDDSLTIEDLQFTYDPIEEWFFAEVGKDESGTYYFDTLNSLYENTYNITSGNLDYNLTIEWCDYHYEFYGLYYENGTYADNVTINAYFIDNIDSFLLDHETTKNYVETPIMFTWELDGGGLRKLYPISNNETYYLFTPFDEYSSYSFEIKDYSGQIGSADSYLESYEVINGTERMVERALIRDAANPTNLVLQKYRTYRLQIRCGTGTVYSFPHFTPAVDSPPLLIIHAIEWGDQIHYVGENIAIEFSRPSYTHIRINYKDEREHTTSIFVEVLLKNLTQVWNDTSTEQLIQFNWYGANNTTDYLVRLIAQHEDFGEIADSDALSGLQPTYQDPPDESVLGDWPINNLLGISMLIGTFCVFSAGTKSNLFGTFATVGVGYVLVLLNFLSTPYYVLHACVVLTLLWGMTGGSN